MSLNFTQDNSVQLSYSSFGFATPPLDNFATSNYTNTLSTNNSNYTTNASNALKANIDTKQDIFTVSLPLNKTGTNVSINLGSYSTTGNDPNYLLRSGGSMTGNLGITSASGFLGFGTRNQNFLIKLSGEVYGFGVNPSTLRYNADTTASHKFYSGTVNTATINSSGNITAISFTGNGANITNVPYSTITGTPTIYTQSEVNGLITASSNYTTNASNALKANIDGNNTTINTAISNTSNYATNISNILITRDATNLSSSSNYTTNVSNALRANIDGNNTTINTNSSNFTSGTSNILRTLINTNLDNSSNYASNISNVLLLNYNSLNTTTNTNTSNYASNVSNVLWTNVNANYVLKSGSTMTGDLTGTNITAAKVSSSDATGVNASCLGRMLNVVGTNAVMRIWRNDGTNSPSMEFISGLTSSATITWFWDMYIGGTTGTNFFAIRDRRPGGTNPVRFIIDTNGNTAIGPTASASYKLTVSGAFNATSIYNNGTLIDFSSYATNTNLTTNYYNKTGSDGRYLNLSGGTITGALTVNGIIKSISGISEFNQIYIHNPGRNDSHLPYTNGQNYLRGYVNIDQDGLYVAGAVSFNSTLSINGNMSGGPNVCKRVQFLFDTQYIFTTIGYRYVKFINLNGLIPKIIGPLGNEQYVFRITIYTASGDYGDSTANVETMQYLIFLSAWGGGFKVRTYQICNESNGSFVAADSYSSIFYSGWNGTGGASQKNCIIENITGY